MKTKQKYKTIGLMSGTSLDGLDIAYCEFEFKDGRWTFDILIGETLPYSAKWKYKLQNAPNNTPEELTSLDLEYGDFLGKKSAYFIQKHQLNPDLVASHGHTVFHKPTEGYTLQIGNGIALRKHLSCPLIFDFRSQDMALGGQGAPLVPIGDQLLFSEFNACVNIGGFANISTLYNNNRVAWDICPANIIMNPIAEKLGKSYDKNGDWARMGAIQDQLLEQLNSLAFYQAKAPKSLGKEWVEDIIDPIIKSYSLTEKDLLATLCEHISDQIAANLPGKNSKVLFTGGGVFNGFLMEQIQTKTASQIIIPPQISIDFKEALIFAFMGVLRIRNEINVLASVTGAKENHSSGKIQ